MSDEFDFDEWETELGRHLIDRTIALRADRAAQMFEAFEAGRAVFRIVDEDDEDLDQVVGFFLGDEG
jgi:hypothetical protein